MVGKEIREQIDKNNEEIVKALYTDFYLLNKDTQALLEKNKELQKICKHKFVDGVCIYCDKGEKE